MVSGSFNLLLFKLILLLDSLFLKLLLLLILLLLRLEAILMSFLLESARFLAKLSLSFDNSLFSISAVISISFLFISISIFLMDFSMLLYIPVLLNLIFLEECL